MGTERLRCSSCEAEIHDFNARFVLLLFDAYKRMMEAHQSSNLISILCSIAKLCHVVLTANLVASLSLALEQTVPALGSK